MRVQRLGIEFQRAAPYCFFQHDARHQTTNMAEQVQAQIEFAARRLHRLAAQHGGPAHGIDFIVADPDQIGRQRLIGIRPAQQRAYPRRQLAGAHRLAHAIVRAVFQRGGHAVFQIRRLRQQQDGLGAPRRRADLAHQQRIHAPVDRPASTTKVVVLRLPGLQEHAALSVDGALVPNRVQQDGRHFGLFALATQHCDLHDSPQCAA